MDRKVDLREELGLEFKIDDFIRRHMSDIQLPAAPEPTFARKPVTVKAVEPIQKEQYSMGNRGGKTCVELNFGKFEDGKAAKNSAETVGAEQENEGKAEEPKLADLERYRPPLAPLPSRVPKQPPKRPEISLSVPTSQPSSALPSPTVRLEATTQAPKLPSTPAQGKTEEKRYNPFELPDAPPFLFVLGNGGMMVSVSNREADYSHRIELGNVRTNIREIPEICNLHYFPGPLDASTSVPILFKYCNERAKESYLWEILKYQLTITKSLFDSSGDSQEETEKVKGALSGSIARLREIPQTAGKSPYSPFYTSVPGVEVAQENAELLKAGKLEEALSHALATSKV